MKVYILITMSYYIIFKIYCVVGQVSVGVAHKLLRMITGMQDILIEHLTNARETLRNYTAIIQNLEQQLVTFNPLHVLNML